MKTLPNNKEENTKEDSIPKQLNKNAYNDPILAQDDTLCFHIVEESVTKELPNGCNLRVWGKYNNKFNPMRGASKTILRKKFAKCELYDVTRDPEDQITELELLRGDLRKLGVIIDDVKIMNHIMSTLPEEYEETVEKIEGKLDDDIVILNIERIWDKLSDKYDKMNALSNQE